MISAQKIKRNRKIGLTVLIALALVLVGGFLHAIWYKRQPVSRHLRDTFKESGFIVPEYVTEIRGSKGFVDFQGDFSASVSFSVRPGDIQRFVVLPPKIWKNPGSFEPLQNDEKCGEFTVPAGSLMITEWTSSEYNCKYAVDEKTNRIYFYRSST